MKIYKKIYLTAFALYALYGFAQNNTNLIINGGFEQWQMGGLYEKPKNWYFSVPSIEKSKHAHTGNFSIKLVPVPHTITAKDANSNYYYMPIEQGATYQLSFWYKGTLTMPNCITNVTWCKGERKISTTSKKTTADMITDADNNQWKQKNITFVAPRGINRAGFNFEMKEVYVDKFNYLLIDDVVFTKIKDNNNTDTKKVPMPQALQTNPQQREVFLAWHPVQEKNAKYNILLNGKTIDTTSNPSYILQKLKPATTYQIGVQTILPNGKTSDVLTKRVTTVYIVAHKDDADRIPYLYQLKKFGDCPRTVFLFIKDLYDDNAKITYTLNGKPFTPIDGYKLVFNKTGKHILIVDITESDGKAWNLEYNLNVR